MTVILGEGDVLEQRLSSGQLTRLAKSRSHAGAQKSGKSWPPR